jgi:hypothetical protein
LSVNDSRNSTSSPERAAARSPRMATSPTLLAVDILFGPTGSLRAHQPASPPALAHGLNYFRSRRKFMAASGELRDRLRVAREMLSHVR